MEHQTCTSLYYAAYTPGLIAHELGHQWFGDLITCADFGHIWLNEGFATWTEAYWLEQSQGMAAYHAEMAAARYLGPGSIFVEDPSNFYAIFDYNLSYLKASWVPHMLRHILGDDDFFAALQLYRATYGYGSATTEDFQAVLEEVSGRDLAAFFQQWIYGTYYPIYTFSWTAVPAGAATRVDVRIEQTQSATGLFTMPLDIRIDTSAGAETFVVENSEQVQWYSFQVDGTATDVQLDPDNWVLRSVIDAGVAPVAAATPQAARILRNAPNPFNPSTSIQFVLPTAAAVKVSVYDVSGRLVRVVADAVMPAGEGEIRWDGTDASGRAVASGTYFARLAGPGIDHVHAMVLVR